MLASKFSQQALRLIVKFLFPFTLYKYNDYSKNGYTRTTKYPPIDSILSHHYTDKIVLHINFVGHMLEIGQQRAMLKSNNRFFFQKEKNVVYIDSA